MKRVLHRKTAVALLLCVTLLFCAARLPAAADTVLLGDLNADGAISTDDARLALRVAVGLTPSAPWYTDVGDTDGSGAVTAADARTILRVAVGLESFGGKTVEAQTDPYAAAAAKLPVVIPPAPEINAPSGTFSFVTYGWGHCVGMSQQGAILMANAGLPYDYILAYYYSGTAIVKNRAYPDTTYYAEEGYVDTYELVTRIVSMEIAGNTQNPEALKAQTVAVFTLLRYFDFYVKTRSSVGIAVKSFSTCSENLRNSVKAVLGEYLTMVGDSEMKPVLTVYGDMAAGRTLSAKEAWGYGDFPVSVSSPFEASLPSFAAVKTFTVEDIRRRILNWNSAVRLDPDPANWIEIIRHDGSLGPDRGYVTQIRVGDQTVSGIGALSSKLGLGLRSPCYTVTYTP